MAHKQEQKMQIFNRLFLFLVICIYNDLRKFYTLKLNLDQILGEDGNNEADEMRRRRRS